MLGLQGVGVLVTRPEGQALPLCRLLEAAGATVARLSAVDIKPAGDVQLLRGLAGSGIDLTIFTSANAVRFGIALLESQHATTLAAIGPATARALGAAGHAVTIIPSGGFDSERLLLHPQLLELRGRRVLIVTGMHGRGLLAEELERRGATVVVAEVYKRERAVHDAGKMAALAARFAAGEIQLITATSAEIAAHLLESATPALRLEFDRALWLVPGARVAAAVRERALGAAVLQAHSAEDQDLLSAIVRWRASVSGA